MMAPTCVPLTAVFIVMKLSTSPPRSFLIVFVDPLICIDSGPPVVSVANTEAIPNASTFCSGA